MDPLVLRLILFGIAVLVLTVWLYLATRLVTGEDEMEGEYLLRLFAVAVVVVLIVPLLSQVGIWIRISELGPVLAFLGITYIVKFLLTSEVGGSDELQEAILIAFLSLVFIYGFNALTDWLLGTRFVPALL